MSSRIHHFVTLLFSFFLLISCTKKESIPPSLRGDTWAEKLGFPKGKRVLILHADDIGMCQEANEAVKPYLTKDLIQSASIMVPCPKFKEIAAWYKDHPEEDMGLHLTLTSEWKTYRWGPVSNPDEVPGLVDPEGYLWRDVPNVIQHASAQEVNREIRAQIEAALAAGIKPGHLDTHMGTVYASLEFTRVYLSIAMEYEIPAMIIEFTPDIVTKFRGQGYPITDEMIAFAATYNMPKLDDFNGLPSASSYEEKKQKLFELVRSLKPGITEIIFHPSVETDSLKKITNSWQQRVWEAQLFSDPEVIQFFHQEGVLFTNWKEMMHRFRERTSKEISFVGSQDAVIHLPPFTFSAHRSSAVPDVAVPAID